MKTKTAATANFKEIAFEEYHVRSRKDHRVFVNRLVIGYETNDGEEYRRSYEFKPGTEYIDMLEAVPQQITVKRFETKQKKESPLTTNQKASIKTKLQSQI